MPRIQSYYFYKNYNKPSSNFSRRGASLKI